MWHLLLAAFGRVAAAELGPPLPERVLALVRAQDAASERLIGWVQLGLVALFGILYLAAPHPTDFSTMAAPVPWALVLLIAATALRLALIHANRLSDRFVILAIVLDTVLLLGLVWAIHLQYRQPAAFSLKVPTFTYVFVLIALRSLRFDPRYVLAAGLSAAIGWAVLTASAVWTSPPGTVTRDFVAALTGNAILIGAEVDKILTIVLVTGILALGTIRAQRTLRTALREEAAAREIGRFLSRGVAHAVASSETVIEAGQAVEREAAVVMLDLRGFTRASTSMSPVAMVELLGSLHARVVPLILRCDGVVDKFLGDGIMATFGAVVPTATPAADAARALELIMDEAARWRNERLAAGLAALHLNGAMTAGAVVFAALGSGDRLEYTVIGAVVNLAAKLEKHNKIIGTRALMEGAAYDLALTQGYRPGMPPRRHRLPANEAHGLDGAIDVVVLRA